MPTATIRYGDAPGVGQPRPLFALLGDDRLVDHVRRGSHAAFEALYERHHRGMLAFCQHMLSSRHDAEEAVQQAFTAAYADLTSGERPIALKPWLYGIARHRCLAMLRKRRLDASSDWSGEGVAPAVTEEVERRSDVRELLLGVSRLPEPQRTALVLFGLCGHCQADVAAVLDCDEARVRALVYQGRNSLLEDRRAREIPCQEIREKLALGRGGALRRRAVRRHIKFCPSCAEFRAEVLRQRRLMGLVAPVVPSVTLKSKVLAAAGLTGSGSAAGGSAIGVGGLSGTAKLVTAALVLAATPVGGGILLRQGGHRPSSHARSTLAGSARAGTPLVGQSPISGAPLGLTWAPREGSAASLGGGFQAPTGLGDGAPAAGPASPPASPADGAVAPAPPTAGKTGAGGQQSAPPHEARRRGKDPEGRNGGGSKGNVSSHKQAPADETPGSRGHGRRRNDLGAKPGQTTPSPSPAAPAGKEPGRDPTRRPCAVPSVAVGHVVVPPECPATT